MQVIIKLCFFNILIRVYKPKRWCDCVDTWEESQGTWEEEL